MDELALEAPGEQDSAVSKQKVIFKHGAGPSPASRAAWPSRDFVAGAATVGAVVAGAALLEAALIPGVAIGAAAMLAPGGLPWLRRNLSPLFKPAKRRPPAPAPAPDARTPLASPLGFPIKQALAKTVTYRIIVTALDFGWNYVVIGEIAAAAGLSAVTLAVAPVFYFVHEAAWSHSSAKARRPADPAGADADPPDAKAPLVDIGGYSVNRALAKTITFRTFSTTTDFAANYAMVRDLPQAAMLTAFGFVVGPFVYLGHEMAWDRFGAPARSPPRPKGVD
jgi:uncharacterized membrane protein